MPVTREQAVAIARRHMPAGTETTPAEWVVDAILAAAGRPPMPDDDDALYEVLNRPVPPVKAEVAVRAFFADVAAARVEHGMPDVQVIVQARVLAPGGGHAPGGHGPRHIIASSYWGDVQSNQLVLLARKYGEARADHERALGDLIEQGRRAAVERGGR